MALSVTQVKTGVLTVAATSLTVTFNTGIAAGSIIVAVGSLQSSANLNSMTDNNSDTVTTWANDSASFNALFDGNSYWVFCKAFFNPTSGTTSVTVNYSAAVLGDLVIYEVAGFTAGTASFDKAVDALLPGSSTAISSGSSGTLAQAAEFAVGFGLAYTGTITAVGSGWANDGVRTYNSNSTVAMSQVTAATTAITATATINTAQFWDAFIATVKGTVSSSAAPFVSNVTNLPPSGYVYSDWYKWTDDTNTLLPTPTVLTQTLRVQKDWPNPYPVTWYRSWEEHTLLPKPTPFLPFDWPNPRPVSWYQSWCVSGNALTAVTQAQFRQNSWPKPQPITWYQSWTRSFQQAIPFNQLDWPLPKSNQPLLQTWSQSLNLFYQSETFPFVQTDWPNPQRTVWYQDWRVNLLQGTLTPTFQAPFIQTDWPLPRTYVPIDQFWQNNLQLLPRPTPFFQNVDFPLPVVSQPIDATWIQNLSEFLQSNTFPFSQTDWKNPYPLYWYRNHNQNLVIYLPVGIQPFNQTDWPLPKTTQPIDQTWLQSLVLNLPEPPPPIVITSAGRWISPEEVI